MIYDIKTATGGIVSSLHVGEDDVETMRKVYGWEYLSGFYAEHGVVYVRQKADKRKEVA